MIRSVLAVVAGALAWILVATALNLVLRFGWQDYAAAEPGMSFTLPMLLLRLLLGVAASFAAGLVAALISRGSRWPVYVVAILLLAAFVPVHYNLWARFPVWYHLFFLASLVAFSYLGAVIRWRYPT
ncbi:MAG TPA: hypothetical protein VGP71_05550 [Burkholderiales bacterium]|jgi:hypothetical protein|nr:hypothetical protein [Burkholderiales bacterium]